MMENWCGSSWFLPSCLDPFSESRRVNFFKVLYLLALLLDAVHVNTVCDCNMVTWPFENLIRTHSALSLHFERILLNFLLNFLRRLRHLERSLLDLRRTGSRLESFIDFELSGESIFHVLHKRSKLRNVGNKGIHLEVIGHELLIVQKLRRRYKSSITGHIKWGPHETIIYYILFRVFFLLFFLSVESRLGFANA